MQQKGTIEQGNESYADSKIGNQRIFLFAQNEFLRALATIGSHQKVDNKVEKFTRERVCSRRNSHFFFSSRFFWLPAKDREGKTRMSIFSTLARWHPKK